jgi:hypothetical protein
MKLFRIVSLVEGVSWLLLLFIAMPLKYGFGEPLMVRWLGRAHGGLFVGPHGLPVGDGRGGESVMPPQQRKIIAIRA